MAADAMTFASVSAVSPCKEFEKPYTGATLEHEQCFAIFNPIWLSRMENNTQLIEMTADVVAAYVSNNVIPAAEVPALIRGVHGALDHVRAGAPEPKALEPAVPIRKSVSNDFLICLEDGKKFKSLKRHLRTRYDMSPQEYREKWGLPADYPMVAPNYARQRSDLAKKMGLGRKAKGRKS
jgi:predicted transcriptional regulator